MAEPAAEATIIVREAPKPAGAHQRVDMRYALHTPGLIADKIGVHDCIIVDLSLGGCMVEGDFNLQNGMEVAVGFDKLMGLVGVVVHTGPGFIGVKFDHTSDRRSEIRAWITARLKRGNAQENP